MTDIVAELDRYRVDFTGDYLPDGAEPMDGLHCGTLRRARDEIVALRERYAGLSRNAHAKRDLALEEAAQACRGALSEKARPDANDMRNACAAAIRALKDKADAPA